MKKWNKIVVPVILAGMVALAAPMGAAAFDLGGALGGITKNLPGGGGGSSPSLPGGGGVTPQSTCRTYVEENGSRAPLDHVCAYYGTNLRTASENGTEVVYGESYGIGASDENGLFSLDLPNGVYTVVFWKHGYTSQTMRVTAPGPVPDVVLHPGGNQKIDFRK